MGIDLHQHNLQQIGRVFRIELGIATERDNESAPSLASRPEWAMQKCISAVTPLE